MRFEEIRTEKVSKVLELLRQAHQLDHESDQAEYLVDHGLEPREEAEWVFDQSYTGKNKKIYVCSGCNHWESLSISKPSSIFFKKYCPTCGRKMKVGK